MLLKDKVALITGAGSGIGRASAIRFAQEGAKVVAADLRPESAANTASEIGNAGGTAKSLAVDVRSGVEVERMVDETVRAFGRLDILFNNAGIADPAPFLLHEYPTENWRRVLSTDLDGVFYCAREALKVMAPRRSGKVINIASMWGLAGSSSLFPAPAYNAAKGAVVNLTRELGLQYATQGIQVNALCPGFYRTRLGAFDDPDTLARVEAFIPMGHVAEAADIKGPALFLASPASDYMTGQTLVTDGGCMAK
jgi:NAD(P)-dependent dehydrogenase (short-subunit alcohol dehydrogenase family)